MRQPTNYDPNHSRHRTQKLKEAHPELTYAAIAQQLGISKATAWRYLRGVPFNRRFHRWTPEEIASLEALAEIVPLTEIAFKLDRSENAVRFQLFCLGLRARTTLDNYSAKLVAEHLGVNPKAVVKWISQGLLKATKPRGLWRILACDFADFCRDNPEISSQFDQEIVDWLCKGGKNG